MPLSELAQRLLAALFVGALVGWERERKNKPAGLRTHMLVTLGSATFCIMAFEVGAAMADRYGDSGLDPMRVLQGVVGGIGFLGAGSIIQSHGNVRGVTTAAGVWIAGALGAACGVGAYVLALISATLTLLVLSVVGWLEHRYLSSEDEAPKPEPATHDPAQRDPPAADSARGRARTKAATPPPGA
jgi:putative Mg2+ transporter-C (MgtC) family protein